MELCVGFAHGCTNAACGGAAAVLLWSHVPSPVIYSIVSPGSKISLSGVMILFWIRASLAFYNQALKAFSSLNQGLLD